MPNGQPAPVSHQHADDTSLHVLQPSDAQMAIDSSIALFCSSRCSQLNANKSQGFLVQAQPLSSATVSALPGISFITGQQTVKHLGVRLGYDMQAACHQTFIGIYHAIKAKVCHWSACGLSFLGRVHVAKQVLAASLWYHATLQRPSKQLLNQISSQLRNYVASTQQSSHSDAGMALAQGNSQNPAQPLSQAPTASLYPGQITSSLLPAKGGVGLVNMPTQVQALQAKVVSRLLEPEQLAWKVFQNHHLGLAPQLQCLAYGASILFSTVSTQSLHLPARLNGYVTGFRALQPHRLLPVSAMHAEDVLNEPLFFIRQITVLGMPSSNHSHQLALSPLACHDRPHASGLSCYHFGSYHGRRAVRFRDSSSDMAQTQTGSAAQHLGGISGCSACLSHLVASTGFSSAFTAPCTADQQASTQDHHCHGSPRLGEVQ